MIEMADKKGKGLTLVIAVGGKPPKKPTDTAKPDMKKAFDVAWGVVKAIPEANSRFSQQNLGELPHTMDTSSAEPLQSFNVDDKLDLENDLNEGRAKYMGADMGHRDFRGNIAADYRPQGANEGNEEYYRGLLEEMLRGKISGRKDMDHDPEMLRDYDERQGELMDNERTSALAEGMEPPMPQSQPQSGEIGIMSPRNVRRFNQGMGPSTPF